MFSCFYWILCCIHFCILLFFFHRFAIIECCESDSPSKAYVIRQMYRARYICYEGSLWNVQGTSYSTKKSFKYWNPYCITKWGQINFNENKTEVTASTWWTSESKCNFLLNRIRIRLPFSFSKFSAQWFEIYLLQTHPEILAINVFLSFTYCENYEKALPSFY